MLFPTTVVLASLLLTSPDVLVVFCLCHAFCGCVPTAVVSSLESLLRVLESLLLLPTLLLLRSLVVPAVVGPPTVLGFPSFVRFPPVAGVPAVVSDTFVAVALLLL